MTTEWSSGAAAEERWILLTAGLTSLRFGNAIDLRELLNWIDEQCYDPQMVRALPTTEWQSLADYATDVPVQLRAKRYRGWDEFCLSTNELRNYRLLFWTSGEDPQLEIHEVEPGLSGWFRKRARERDDFLVHPVIKAGDLGQVSGREKRKTLPPA